MITILFVWDKLLYEEFMLARFTSPLRVLICLLLSIIFIPIDIILLPLEILAIIIYKLISKEE